MSHLIVALAAAIVAAVGFLYARLTQQEDTGTHCVGAAPVAAHAPRHAATLPRLTVPGRQPWDTATIPAIGGALHG